MPRNRRKKEKNPPMKNITIYIPNNYDQNIQWLISQKLIASRSEAIRNALHTFLQNEYDKNLDLLGFERINGIVGSTNQSKPESTIKTI
ncbi:MAG: ribbon-helix-helix domain-containing protein [Candidatus Hodarchaeota archaeon]